VYGRGGSPARMGKKGCPGGGDSTLAIRESRCSDLLLSEKKKEEPCGKRKGTPSCPFAKVRKEGLLCDHLKFATTGPTIVGKKSAREKRRADHHPLGGNNCPDAPRTRAQNQALRKKAKKKTPIRQGWGTPERKSPSSCPSGIPVVKTLPSHYRKSIGTVLTALSENR